MADAGPPFAPLTATMIRRQVPPAPFAEPAAEPADEVAPRWREDLRLFAFTWLAGFVFFLVFLA